MNNIENLIESYIESAIYIDENYMDRVVKIHNKHANNIMKITKYLEKHNVIHVLYPLLKHPTNYVRFTTAYRLLPYFEQDAKKVYDEIIKMDIPLMSSNARISLQQWEENKNKENQN